MEGNLGKAASKREVFGTQMGRDSVTPVTY